MQTVTRADQTVGAMIAKTLYRANTDVDDLARAVLGEVLAEMST